MTHKLLIIILVFCSPVFTQTVERVTPKLYRLGRIYEGTVIKDTLRFVNTGEKTVTITKVQSSCGCTTTTLDEDEITPGDTGLVAFQLRTRGYQSTLRKDITVIFKEKKLKPLKFTIQAFIYTNWEARPRYIYFSRVGFNPDTTLSKILEIENFSDHIIQVKEIKPGDSRIRVKPASGPIEPGRKMFVQVQMTPDSMGTLHNTLEIQTDDEFKPKTRIPVYMQVME
jgi:hypothetical protein